MSSCSVPPKTLGCGPSDFGRCQTLKQMVDLFLSDRRDRPARERGWWGDPHLSIRDACLRAMFALEKKDVRDDHQWIFSKARLSAMGEQIAARAAVLEAAETFEEFYGRVELALGIGRNRKPLLVYDIARRLGYRFGLEPEEVYLHRGTKAGAEALRRGLGRPRSRSLDDFPTSLRTRLTPAQAEDFLCLAAKHLSPALWD